MKLLKIFLCILLTGLFAIVFPMIYTTWGIWGACAITVLPYTVIMLLVINY